MTPASSLFPESPLTLRTSYLIGRDNFVDAIRASLNDTTGRCYLLYFVGVGGIGKTRLLEEVDVLQENWPGQPLRCTPIIDLYHSEQHSQRGLRKAVVDGLDQSNEFFYEYRQTLDKYKEKQAEGAPPDILGELRQVLEHQFKEAYAALAKNYRIVLRFDTLELLQHESDLVQQLCQVDDADAAIKTWLLEQIRLLPNTVILCAGRPQLNGQRQVIDDIERACIGAGHIFKKIEVESLSAEDTDKYLANLLEKHPDKLGDILIPKNRPQFYKITSGRPIYLALLVDLACYSLGDVLSLTPEGEQERRRKMADMLERDLPEHLGEVIQFLSVARKGLDYALLHFLVGERWTTTEIEESMQLAQELAIVKSRKLTSDVQSTDTNPLNEKNFHNLQLFLHDEIYELFDECYKDDGSYGQQFEKIANYYRREVEGVNSHVKREDWALSRLYYELQVNPRVGYYRYYVRWDEEAIRVREFDLDMRLRDEVLRFINRYAHDPRFQTKRVFNELNHTLIDRDCAARWVKRFVTSGKSTKALQVAEKLRNSTEPLFDWNTINDPIYKASLLTAWGEVLLYTAEQRNETYVKLNEAVQLLEAYDTSDADLYWIWARTLGRAHNNIGYLYRTEGRYTVAREQYQQALPYFTHTGIRDEEANTRNNLAFVLAALGRLTAARKQAEQALQLREREGKPYPIALSKNTLAQIYILEDHPVWGIKLSEEALAFFERFKANRGIGLGCIRLGFAMRRRGDQWKQWKLGDAIFPLQEVEASFIKGVDVLERAVQIFSSSVNEPSQLWEAHNELGSLYCDWAWFARDRKKDQETALKYYQQSIVHQTKALQIAEKRGLEFQIADSLDDLAQAHGDLCFLLLDMRQTDEANSSRAKAEDYLRQLEQIIPPAFKLKSDQGFVEAPKSGEAYWLSLGKARFWSGVWIFRDIEAGAIVGDTKPEKLQQAVQQLIEAVAYFQRFDESRSYLLQRTLRYITDFIQQQRIPMNQVHEQVNIFARAYGIDLKVLHETIDDMLGV